MLNMNDAYIEDLYFEYVRDPESVDAQWRTYFETSGYRPEGQEVPPVSISSAPQQPVEASPSPTPSVKPTPSPEPVATPKPVAASTPPEKDREEMKNTIKPGPDDVVKKLTGLPEKIATNMEASLQVPTATSFRTLPVKALEENRTIINHFELKRGNRKLSFTHIVAWAMVRALKKFPGMNDTYGYIDGKPHRIIRENINFGLAVDVQRKDGSRTLLVPSIKKAQTLNFQQFVAEYNQIINKARNNKLTVDDLTGTTVSLTNPGGIGTVASMPRLMAGQGLIVATGSINFPSEFKAVDPQMIKDMAVSKVMQVTSTYDHRIIQGAESGEFLRYMEQLLLGEDNFYDQIYAAYSIPFEAIKWDNDHVNSGIFHHDEQEVVVKESRVLQLINAYRVRGHLYANINPLGLDYYYYPELELKHYKFTLWDLDRTFNTGGLGGVKRATLRDIIVRLWDTYCGKIGLEFMHIQEPNKKSWIREKFEGEYASKQFAPENKLRVYKKLVQAEIFETFLHTKFLGQKRFSLEGGEALIPLLDQIIDKASVGGVEEINMGMAHRGRLNVLVNILKKSSRKIFAEFKGLKDEDSFHGSGDVKYHLGEDGSVLSKESGKEVRLVLASNPSHLEAVDPVVEGMTRARQHIVGDKTCDRVMPVLIHGDSAFAGQGVVSETLNLANLPGYRTGGTIHVIVNNQIGFTTAPQDARSTVYCTDVAKMLQVPILHVNADDPEAVLRAAAFAVEYRNTFKEDVVIDMLCYRKYGHNEQDEPGYTQPLLYKKIRALEAPSVVYGRQLQAQGLATAEELQQINDAFKKDCEDAFDQASGEKATVHLRPHKVEDIVFSPVHTAISTDKAHAIARKLNEFPEGFAVHRKLKNLLQKRMEAVVEDKGIDWGVGEALAFGSLVIEGHPVRVSGQDSGRGTFSHRHSVLTDNVNESEFIPLNALTEDQARFTVFDSSLSEMAVLGFEYGYSVTRPDALTIWEAQFGDFSNGAQIIIDQFISSAEQKWNQRSNLVMLLPHGYEGQGPEHSSARLERYLQLCAEENMFVMNLTTPAQLFHALRRQVIGPVKKPMIVMSPKANLRLPVSHVKDFTEGSFQEVIDDSVVNANGVKRIILCSGKVYYDLEKKRDTLSADNVAIIRIEQIYPLHSEKLKDFFAKYEHASDVVWVQEEPKNMGAWNHIALKLMDLLNVSQKLHYIGRAESASTATGYADYHAVEQEDLVSRAFGSL